MQAAGAENYLVLETGACCRLFRVSGPGSEPLNLFFFFNFFSRGYPTTIKKHAAVRQILHKKRRRECLFRSFFIVSIHQGRFSRKPARGQRPPSTTEVRACLAEGNAVCSTGLNQPLCAYGRTASTSQEKAVFALLSVFRLSSLECSFP